MTRSGITLWSWNSQAPIARNTGLYLSRSVSAKQSGWLQNLWTDAGTCVHCTNTCLLLVTPAAVTSDLKQCIIDTSASISQNVIDKAVGWWRTRFTCEHHWRMTSLWTSAKLKPAFFRANAIHSRLFFRATYDLPRKTHCFASISITAI